MLEGFFRSLWYVRPVDLFEVEVFPLDPKCRGKGRHRNRRQL